MRSGAYLLTILLATAACASQGASQRPPPAARAAPAGQTASAAKPAQPPSDGRMVCEMERPTGSNIPERVCRWVPAIDNERMQAQDAIRNLPRVQMQRGP